MKKNNLELVQCDFSKSEWGYEHFNIDVANFIKDLRILVNKTINEFIYDLGWTNDKYYSKIVNGYYINGEKKYSIPTVNYLFGAINHAIYNSQDWKNKKNEIKKLIEKYFLKEF